MRVGKRVGSGRLIAAALLAAGAAGAGTAPPAHAQESLKFTIGMTQDIDSINPLAGALVVDFEVWNNTLPTLTTKAASDMSIEPFLATKWESSADNLTWTYTLRDGAKWSDGQPLTAEDVAYTINRSVEEQWGAYTSNTGNLKAEVTDPTTLVVTSSVPDPKLPGLDFYIVPKHVYEKLDKDAVLTYAADDYVSGGPFMVEERKEGEFLRMVRNPNWWGETKPSMDEVIIRFFTNEEAMFAALQNGELDAVESVPPEQFVTIDPSGKDGITPLLGELGGFSELGMNNGCSSSPSTGHPALKEKLVRQAINVAIDRDVLVDKVWNGFARPEYVPVASINPKWDFTPPADKPYTYDPDKAKALLDQAGWTDPDGDGTRSKDGVDLKLRYFDRTTAGASKSTPFIVEWLKAVGIRTEVETIDEATLATKLGQNDFDLFTWGWVPYFDPDAQLSYFTKSQVTFDAATPGFNDANWCNAEYDALYDQQHTELDAAKRVAIVQQMLGIFYEEAPYAVLYRTPELQAARTDRWTNLVRQPDKTGAVFFNNTSPVYLQMQPVGAESPTTTEPPQVIATAPASGSGAPETLVAPPDSGSDAASPPTAVVTTKGDDGGSSSTGVVAAVVGGAAALGLAGVVTSRRRRPRDDDDRE